MASSAFRTFLLSGSSRCLRSTLLKRAQLHALETPRDVMKFCATPNSREDAAATTASKQANPSIGGPEYFKSLYDSSHEMAEMTSTHIQTTAEESPQVFQVPNVADLENDDLTTLQNELAPEPRLDALSTSVDAEFLDEMGPALPKSFNLAAYANKSITVQRFVQLGMDLSVCERKGLGQELITLDFEKDVEPLIHFLTSKGVPADRLGWWFTKNPYVFREPLENLQVRIDYLVSKRFSPEAVTRIVTNAPLFLAFRVESMDHRLGFLQRTLSLSGAEVRHIVTRFPKLPTFKLHSIECNAFAIKEEMGFTKYEMKQMIMVCPKLLVSSRDNIVNAFAYLHQEAGLSHAQLVQFPPILRTRECIYKPRHQFLVKLGRAQFDPKEPNYVSPQALVVGTDAVFCENVAKTSVDTYNAFLKTL
uniref:Putative transcription termination factor mterf n=1 Tax=Amblyomma aureolatum TaxID=187763 RepID=A0A1E1X6K4_9ACAR